MMLKPMLEPTKRYRYTWPGCAQQVLLGDALAEILKGADPSMLAIEDVIEQEAHKIMHWREGSDK